MSIRNVRESTKKKIAGKQYYKCANEPSIILYNLKNYKCPMWLLYNGSFDESGYEIDHIKEFSISHNDMESNLQALCVSCHRVKTRNFMHNIPRKPSVDYKELRKPSVDYKESIYEDNTETEYSIYDKLFV